MKYFPALLGLLTLSASALLAEEPVQAMVFFEEPVTLTAVPEMERHLLVVLPQPGIMSPVYAFKGWVRYEEVEGEAFLQMNNDFGEQGTFFTKTVAESGSLGVISGSSDWRPFVLPFYVSGGEQSDGATRQPEELTLALHMPASGTVSVRDVTLYQYAEGEDPMQIDGQWYSHRTAGMIGGTLGTAMGLWGALIGVLSARGKARGFAQASANGMLIVGLGILVAAIIAFATSQPYPVYYSLLLPGAIIVGVTGLLRRSLLSRYEELELKKMQSMDA